MNGLNQQVLQETLASVLADCAFLLLDPTTDAIYYDGDVVEVRLPFHGTPRGEVRLAAPTELLALASADMLGDAEPFDCGPEQAEAALRELGNVFLGVLLARAFGSENCPIVGLPRSRRIAELALEGGAACSATLLDMQGLPVVAQVRLDAGASP